MGKEISRYFMALSNDANMYYYLWHFAHPDVYCGVEALALDTLLRHQYRDCCMCRRLAPLLSQSTEAFIFEEQRKRKAINKSPHLTKKPALFGRSVIALSRERQIPKNWPEIEWYDGTIESCFRKAPTVLDIAVYF